MPNYLAQRGVLLRIRESTLENMATIAPFLHSEKINFNFLSLLYELDTEIDRLGGILQAK